MAKREAAAPATHTEIAPGTGPQKQTIEVPVDRGQAATESQPSPSPTKPVKRNRSDELEFWDNVPYLEVGFELYNDVLMEALNRNIGRLPQNAYLVEGLPLARDWDDVVNIMQIKLDAMFSAVEKRVIEEQRSADLLIERLGIDAWPKYTRPRAFTMRQTTPRVGEYISLLRKADNLLIKVELLHLTGSIKRDELKKQRKEWKSIMTRLANRVDGEANRVRSALKRKSHKQRALVNLMNEGATTDAQGDDDTAEEETGDAESLV